MMKWFTDPDGNFIEQFQSQGFDARIWELYLFATLVESGYRVERTESSPDFFCTSLSGEFFVEAVTVNPTQNNGVSVAPPPHETPEQWDVFQKQFMPIKFGSALVSKLSNKYWNLDHVRNRPLVFAIQDFHATGSMVLSRSGLPIYLYGYDHFAERDKDGKLSIKARKVNFHKWEKKEIPSGFFDLPGAENVSAVIFSNSGTIAKFNRMGVVAGFGSPAVKMIRDGFVYNPDPDSTTPLHFSVEVNDKNYSETWIEGLEIYHNVNAVQPLNPGLIPNALHHRILPDGRIESAGPSSHPLTSTTHVSTDR
jgi:hypothetical protein